MWNFGMLYVFSMTTNLLHNPPRSVVIFTLWMALKKLVSYDKNFHSYFLSKSFEYLSNFKICYYTDIIKDIKNCYKNYAIAEAFTKVMEIACETSQISSTTSHTTSSSSSSNDNTNKTNSTQWLISTLIPVFIATLIL